VITIEGIHKWFGKEHVIRGVSLKVDKGQVVALCGPSGSGKSTLLRCINRLEDIQEGEITVDGISLKQKKLNLRELRAKIGIVFQQFNLYPHMTVLQNITLAPIHVKHIPKDIAIIRAKELLDRIGMPEKIYAYPSELSGGQIQRVAIAREMAMDPVVMLFDEPTSNLDPELTAEVLAVVDDLTHTGMTIVIVTHEINFAQKSADLIAFMDKGEISFLAPPEIFFSSQVPQRIQEFVGMLERKSGRRINNKKVEQSSEIL